MTTLAAIDPDIPPGDASADGRTASVSRDPLGYQLQVFSPARADLPGVCLAELARLNVKLRSLSIFRDGSRFGGRQLSIETYPCSDRAVLDLLRVLGVPDPERHVRRLDDP